MFPTEDRMLHSQEEFKADDLLPYLPAGFCDLQKRTKLSTRKLQSMLVALKRQGKIHFRGHTWMVRDDKNTQGTGDRDQESA
jgi:hypothetical protein